MGSEYVSAAASSSEHIVQHPLKGDFDLSQAQWRRSGRIEIAFVGNLIGMRNGDDPDGPVLIFDEAEWDAFVAGAKDGEFDLPPA